MKEKTSARAWLSAGSTALLVLCALIITGLVVHRELFPPSTEPLAFSFYDGWRDLAAVGNRLGEVDAPVQMVVFYDYECPFCRSLEPTIEQLRAKYQRDIAVTFRHFPLESIHPQARKAALAVECGADQGRFATFHRILFENAGKFGQVGWEELAETAGVPDRVSFMACLDDRRHNERIARDRADVSSLGIEAIPGIVINGVVVTGAKPFEVLDRIVQQALDEFGSQS